MPTIPCWEYDIIVFDPEEDDEKFYKDLDELNKIGMEGWEICGVFSDNGVVLVKRPSEGIIVNTGSGTRRKRPERKVRE